MLSTTHQFMRHRRWTSGGLNTGNTNASDGEPAAPPRGLQPKGGHRSGRRPGRAVSGLPLPVGHRALQGCGRAPMWLCESFLEEEMSPHNTSAWNPRARRRKWGKRRTAPKWVDPGLPHLKTTLRPSLAVASQENIPPPKSSPTGLPLSYRGKAEQTTSRFSAESYWCDSCLLRT